MDSISIEILIDNPTREFTIVACIKKLIEDEKQFEVSIDHQDPYNRVTYYDFLERTKKDKDVIITPNYNVGRMKNLLARGVRQNAKIIINHSEQLFPEVFNEEKLNLKYKEEYNRQVDGHIVWGKSFARRLVEKSGVQESKVYIAGNPKLDLARRKNEITGKDDEYKSHVLIVSDFSLGDYNEEEWRLFKDTYKVETSEPVHRHYKEARRRCVEWVSRAAEKHQNIKFMMRTHPGEDRSPYKKLRKEGNIEITGNREFYSDLRKADIVFEYTSSSIFESLVQKKPVYNLQLMEQTDTFYSTYSELFEWVDEQRFNDLIEKQALGGEASVKKKRLKKISKYMWDPQDRNITQNAIAIRELSKKIKNDSLTYSIRDKIISIVYILSAMSKSILLRFGVYLYGLSGWIYDYSRIHWKGRIQGKDYISNRMVSQAIEKASTILEEDDYNIMIHKNYKVSCGSYGKLINLD